ncbi:DoxX family protein [Streptomyces sp. NPDC051211]|uniref:DoxX family protein n=1 Tax=Streptomyces sp. NPDC051211 TaxID=3154643 RepID=UPI00344D5DB0
MFIAFVAVTSLLALALTGSATMTATRHPQIVTNMQNVQVPEAWLPRLAAVKAAGAVGLVAGIWLAPLGIAAAIGVVLFFIGAVTAHVRAGDKALAPALVLGLLAAASLVLRTLSA